MERFDPSRPDALPHAGTFNNNTLTMTAGLAAPAEVFTPAACAALNERGDRLRQALEGARHLSEGPAVSPPPAPRSLDLL